jgi:ribosomal protein S18 acetylase RimI-like enzyme
MQRTQTECAPASAPQVAVDVRPTRMDDNERVRRFVAGLSLESQTQRFFSGLTRPTPYLVRAMIKRDERRDALLAVHGETVIGHAMSCREGDEAEIAVVVADEWQNAGIGSRLVHRLVRRVAAAGARRLTMDVRGDNRKVLFMVRRAWPDATMRAESGCVGVRTPLAFGEQGSVTSPLIM